VIALVPSSALCLEMTCPRCDSALAAVNERRLSGCEHVSVWACGTCHAEWVVRVGMLPVHRTLEDGSAGCGTPAGFRRHVRAGETACPACQEARRAYDNPTQRPHKANPKKVGKVGA